MGGGCGGGINADEMLKVTYPTSAATGAQLTATWVGASDVPTDSTRTTPWGPLPTEVPAGQFLVVLVTGVLTITGTYALELAPTLDHARLPFVPVGMPALFSGAAQKWSGKACLTPAMQAQIPAPTTPRSYYICPEQ